MQSQATSVLSADSSEYHSPEWNIVAQSAHGPADEIAFIPHDADKPVSPEDIGMASVETLVSNVHRLFDTDRQDRFQFD